MKPPRLRSEIFMTQAMDAWADTVYRIALFPHALGARRRRRHAGRLGEALKSTTAFEDEDHLKAWLISVTLNRCREVQRLAERRKTVPSEKVPRRTSSPAADEILFARKFGLEG